MKYLKYIFIFLLSLTLTTLSILAYFKLGQKVSGLYVPQLPSISLQDIVKFSRFSLEKAPTQSLVGNITDMSGEILYESRLATESAKLEKATEVQQGEELSTGVDGQLTLNFKDAAEINLKQNSGIKIIQTLPNDLVFTQVIGTVNYKKLGTIPVSVKVGHLLVENGGTMEIGFTSDSPITTIVVVDGTAVVAYNNLNNDTKVINMTAGQTLGFNEGNRRAVLKN